MQDYGDSKLPFEGKNENGEIMLISIGKTNITTRTLQHNGWMRINSYTFDEDGTLWREETFER